MSRNKIGMILFALAMLFFHYHSTIHFVWAALGIKTKFPLDPIEGWWALLKGILPPLALWIVFFAGLLTKNKKTVF